MGLDWPRRTGTREGFCLRLRARGRQESRPAGLANDVHGSSVLKENFVLVGLTPAKEFLVCREGNTTYTLQLRLGGTSGVLRVALTLLRSLGSLRGEKTLC